MRLSAVATSASSRDRGAQPSMRRAFSLVAFFVLPSSGTICRTDGSASDASRTSQIGQLAGRHAARRCRPDAISGQCNLAQGHEIAGQWPETVRPWPAGRSWRAGAGRRHRARRPRRSDICGRPGSAPSIKRWTTGIEVEIVGPEDGPEHADRIDDGEFQRRPPSDEIPCGALGERLRLWHRARRRRRKVGPVSSRRTRQSVACGRSRSRRRTRSAPPV